MCFMLHASVEVHEGSRVLERPLHPLCLQPVSELHLSLLPSESEGVCSSALCDVTTTADTYSRLVTEPPWFLPLRQRCPCPLPNMWKGATRNQV